MKILIGCDRIVSQWVRERLENAEFGPHSTMGIVHNGRLIAGLIFRDYKGHDICIDIAAESPRWCQKGVLAAIFQYIFGQLGCIRCTGLQPASNTRAHRMIEGLGFTKEGVIRDGFKAGEDLWIYGMLKSECRWWNEQGQQTKSTKDSRSLGGSRSPDSGESGCGADRSAA